MFSKVWNRVPPLFQLLIVGALGGAAFNLLLDALVWALEHI